MSVESYYQHNAALEGLIRSIAKESGKVFFPTRDSNHLGDISISLIFATLEQGVVHLNPEPNEYEHITCTLKHEVSGVVICLDLAIDVKAKEIHILHAEED